MRRADAMRRINTLTVPVAGASRLQAERRVEIGDEQQGIPDDAVVPANDPFYEVIDALRVPPGEQDGNPGDDHDHEHRNVRWGRRTRLSRGGGI
jgi:hypothetical protein